MSGRFYGHYFKCWYPVGTPEGKDALERNLAAKLPQAEAAVAGDASAAAKVELEV